MAPVVERKANVRLDASGGPVTLQGLALGNANNVECGFSYAFPEMRLYGTERAFASFSAEAYFADSGAPVQAAAYLGGGLEYRPPSLDFIPLRLSLDFGCGRFGKNALGNDDRLYALTGAMFAARPELSVGWRMSESFFLFLGFETKFAFIKGNAPEPICLSGSSFAIECIASIPAMKKEEE